MDKLWGAWLNPHIFSPSECEAGFCLSLPSRPHPIPVTSRSLNLAEGTWEKPSAFASCSPICLIAYPPPSPRGLLPTRAILAQTFHLTVDFPWKLFWLFSNPYYIFLSKCCSQGCIYLHTCISLHHQVLNPLKVGWPTPLKWWTKNTLYVTVLASWRY